MVVNKPKHQPLYQTCKIVIKSMVIWRHIGHWFDIATLHPNSCYWIYYRQAFTNPKWTELNQIYVSCFTLSVLDDLVSIAMATGFWCYTWSMWLHDSCRSPLLIELLSNWAKIQIKISSLAQYLPRPQEGHLKSTQVLLQIIQDQLLSLLGQRSTPVRMTFTSFLPGIDGDEETI